MLLARAVAAVKSDEAGALAMFDAPNGGFKDCDLHVFCFDRRSGIVLAGPPTTRGKDVRTLRDPNGEMFGQEMFADVKDNDIVTVDYFFPKPNSTVPVAKESFVEGLGNIACGVGYYKTSAQAAADASLTAREQHACTVVMGLAQGGNLYNICIRSLNRTLAELDQERLGSARRAACAQAGLRPGTPSFAGCIVKIRDTRTKGAASRIDAHVGAG